MAMDKIPIMTTVRGSERYLISRKKRQVKKCGKLAVNRYWKWVMAGEKRARIFTFFENVLGPICPECNDILGEGWECKTCIASLPELTAEEQDRMEQFNLSEVCDMAGNESEKCEHCGGEIHREKCQDCGHENFTSGCTCDSCIMIEEEDGDESE